MKKFLSRKLLAFLIVIGLATFTVIIKVITGGNYALIITTAYGIYQTGKTVERKFGDDQ